MENAQIQHNIFMQTLKDSLSPRSSLGFDMQNIAEQHSPLIATQKHGTLLLEPQPFSNSPKAANLAETFTPMGQGLNDNTFNTMA